MLLRNFLRFSVFSAGLFCASSLFAQALKPDDLSSVKALIDPAVTFKKSLKLATGELSVGHDADNLSASSLLTSYKLDANSYAAGVVTFCPEGMIDNQAKAGCKIIGIVNSYAVNSSNVERWVSEIKAQLIGASSWFITPQNYPQIAQSAMGLASISDDVFEECVVRLAQSSDKNSESCFKTKNNNERIALYFRLCHASINGMRGDLIITRTDSEPDYCAIDPKSGLATTLKFDQRNNRIGVAIMTMLPPYEFTMRSEIREQMQQKQEFKSPGQL